MIPLLLAAALGLANPVIQNHGNPPTRVLVNQTPKKQAIVTITYVKSAWYVNKPLLKRGFRKAIPTYKVIDGLDKNTSPGLATTRLLAESIFGPVKKKLKNGLAPNGLKQLKKSAEPLGR